MTHWLRGQPPKVRRQSWPQAPSLFYEPHPIGFGYRGPKKSSKAVVREGHRFEGKVMDAIVGQAERNGWVLLPEFCMEYKNSKMEWRKIYIDVLAINVRAGAVVVLEMKRTHTANSYEQIWRYMAMVKAYFGEPFAVLGYEICLYKGATCDYPGPHRWLCPGQMVAQEWCGLGMPTISVVPWYMGKFYL